MSYRVVIVDHQWSHLNERKNRLCGKPWLRGRAGLDPERLVSGSQLAVISAGAYMRTLTMPYGTGLHTLYTLTHCTHKPHTSAHLLNYACP